MDKIEQIRIDAAVKGAFKSGDLMMSAGRGLATIAEILGALGSEHNLIEDDRYGLLHATRAIGELLIAAGSELASEAEMAGALDKRGVAQ